MRRQHATLLMATAFLTGCLILVLEVLGFRMFAPYFGNSVYVTGSLLGIILSALAVGYFLGGMLADAQPRMAVPYYLVLGSAAYQLLVYWEYVVLLGVLQSFDHSAGVLLGSIVIFGPPMVLLSMVAPFIIRLLGRMERLGSISGRIYAISTVGSIAGSFLATFVLIPEFGTSATLATCAATSFLLAAAGLLQANRAWALTPFASALLLIPPHHPADESVVFEAESLYNNITVRDRHYPDGDLAMRVLALNDPGWVTSIRYFGFPESGNYLDYLVLVAYLTEIRSAAVLGMGGGTSVSRLLNAFPVEVDAVEIDPAVVRVAREYFDLPSAESLRVHIADARQFLRNTGKRYDMIELDVFSGGPYAPFFLLTHEFFTLAGQRLNPSGILVMNVIGNIDIAADEMLPNAVANTLANVFDTVLVLPLRDNTLLLAFLGPVSGAELEFRLSIVPEDLAGPAAVMRQGLREYVGNSRYPVLTDDFAPVELYTRHHVQRIRSRNRQAGISGAGSAR